MYLILKFKIKKMTEKKLPLELNKIHNFDCLDGFKKLEDNSIDLICTSPPYNVGIDYDTWNDKMLMPDYYEWCKKWLSEAFRVLKKDGRIAINIPYEINSQERGGRVFFLSEYWQMMKEIGYMFFGMVDLEEKASHRVKRTAWGSWMSPSAPYIYNPKEAVILAYKESYKKLEKGEAEWKGKSVEVIDKNGNIKTKIDFEKIDKDEFIELVFVPWKYQADVKSLTKATYSMDIPMKAIKILTYKNDIVLDPFSGSGTTAVAAKITGRNYIGFEISENYTKIANNRVQSYMF